MIIKEILAIPEAEIGNVISKKVLFEAVALNTRDKELFTKNVKQIKWIYKINEETLRVKPYKDSQREYLEVEVINILLKKCTSDSKLNRIVDIILRFIPYPILLVIQFGDAFRFYVSHISESLADLDKITLDKIISTKWIDDIGEFELKLIDDIQLDNLDFKNTYTFYDSIIEAIINYNGSCEVGVEVELDSNVILEINEDIKAIDLKINEFKSKIKKEPNFNKQMEYNIEIHKLKEERVKLEEKLKGD